MAVRGALVFWVSTEEQPENSIASKVRTTVRIWILRLVDADGQSVSQSASPVAV
jgi:hypothetical protein